LEKVNEDGACAEGVLSLLGLVSFFTRRLGRTEAMMLMLMMVCGLDSKRRKLEDGFLLGWIDCG